MKSVSLLQNLSKNPWNFEISNHFRELEDAHTLVLCKFLVLENLIFKHIKIKEVIEQAFSFSLLIAHCLTNRVL